MTSLNAQLKSQNQILSFPQHQISLVCVEPIPPSHQSDRYADADTICQIFELLRSSKEMGTLSLAVESEELYHVDMRVGGSCLSLSELLN